MKRIVLSLLAISLFSINLFADRMVNSCVYTSSYTATNDATAYIDDSQFLFSVVVGSASTAGVLKVYNSTYTSVGQIATINLEEVGTYTFNAYCSEGITYTTTDNANGVTLNYRK